MRVAIVEDDPQVRQTLTGYVHRYERQYGVTVGPYELQISRPKKKAFMEALTDYIGL